MSKKDYAPIPLPAQGTVFTLDGRDFTVINARMLEKFGNNEYRAGCILQTDECEITIILKSKKPFRMDK